MSTKSAVPIVLVVLGWLILPLIADAGPPLTATVRFGLDSQTGSPFPVPLGHDESSHAKHTLVPRTVVISQGGTVTFVIDSPVHQVAVYEAGTEPGDIDATILTPGGMGDCPDIPLIDDMDGLVAVLGDQPCAGGPTMVSYTFDEPGRYLVICAFLPHFADDDMYGWVIVK